MTNQSKPKIRVAVLYGGRSSEHEVSLMGARNVMQQLDKSRFDVVPVGIDKQGAWYLGDASVCAHLEQTGELALPSPERPTWFMPVGVAEGKMNTTLQMFKQGRPFDVVFPVVHGVLCEDGTIQGLLELADVPYVGSGVLASAVGMDKDFAKRLVAGAGVKVGPYHAIKRAEWCLQQAPVCERINEQLRYPLFVKPANTGSSVGVHKVKTPEALVAAIEDAFLYDTKVLVEQGIVGRELELSVLESRDELAEPMVSVVGEIIPQGGHEFYSYAAKYLDEEGALTMVPAENISQETQARLQEAAKRIFMALDAEGMSRVDVFLEENTNEIYFNEINTIPGFTQISMYPKLMMASGMTYSDLLSHLVDVAMQRYARKKQLRREYMPA